jgi:hypothetical protein
MEVEDVYIASIYHGTEKVASFSIKEGYLRIDQRKVYQSHHCKIGCREPISTI